MSPSELWDSVFSRGFSSWGRRLSTVRIYFNEMSVFSSLFICSQELFSHILKHGFFLTLKYHLENCFFVEKHKVGDSGFPVMLTKSMYLIISFSLLVMAAKETSVEK